MITTVLNYHKGDLEQARKLLGWIGELGGCPRHACMLSADAQVDQADRDELKKLAREAFGHAWSIVVSVGVCKTYAIACNRAFERASHQLQETCRWPFLWLEPDAVPLKKDWLDQLADAYDNQPRRYQGVIVDSAEAKVAPADVKKHMAMVGIYPPDAHSDLVQFFKGERAFDLAAHEFMVPRATHTDLQIQFFPPRDQMIEFKAERTEEDPVNVRTLKSLRPDAVLFHQVKNPSLINVLRPQLIIPKDLSPDLRKAREAAQAPKTHIAANTAAK